MLKLKNKFKYLIILLSVIMIYGCSSTPMLESSYSNNGIKIDGEQSDWAGNIKNIKDKGVGVGFQNDKDNLYVCLVTSNRAEMMKILMMGMTVWLKPDNANYMIGIRYPLRHELGEVRDFGREENQDQPQQRGPEERINRLLANQTELEILNKDGKVLNTYPLSEQDGFEAKIGYSMDQLVYELKVPLQKTSNEYSFNAGLKDKINVGFETGKFSLDEIRNNRKEMQGTPDEDGEEPEGMGGMGGRREGTGRMGGRRGNFGQRFNFAEQMKFDIDLKLADK